MGFNDFSKIAICLTIVLTGCGVQSRIKPGEIPAAVLPSKDDKVATQSVIKSHIAEEGFTPIKNGPKVARVKKIVDRLSVAAGFPKDTFPLHVVDAGDEVNAMAVNGNSIVVYSNLLNKVKDDNELSVVLAHEIGHIMAGHSEEQEEIESRKSAVSVGSTLFGALASVAAAYAGVGSAGAELAGDVAETTTGMVGYGAFVGKFDRTQEYEADQVGLMIMAKAGYDPKASISFWQRAKEVFGSESSTVGAFFSTHPAASNRAERLEELLPIAQTYFEESKVKKTNQR